LDNFRIEPLEEEAPDQSQVAQEKKSSLRSILIDILQTILIAVVLYFLIDSFVARVRVENISMEPTLYPGEFVLVNKLAYRLGSPHRGDIIVFHAPQNNGEDYIKRVIGIPGDTVEVRSNQVFVNGVGLEEPYLAAVPAYSGVWVVPAESLFVLGDNRNQSSDSHSWGFVPLKDVVGAAFLVYWPLENFKFLNNPLNAEIPTIQAPTATFVTTLVPGRAYP
jgi:signal peptidase I